MTGLNTDLLWFKRSAAAFSAAALAIEYDRHPERVRPDGRAEARSVRSGRLCEGSLRRTMNNPRRMRTYTERAASLLECALTKSLDLKNLKSPVMNTYEKVGGGGGGGGLRVRAVLAARGNIVTQLPLRATASSRAASAQKNCHGEQVRDILPHRSFLRWARAEVPGKGASAVRTEP